ncbi:hypothetical protein HY442_01775 [Candidatus Parcubacteria bacterium]|nr:hypothetical protein [Candidatus Parcubacteria bacterium]
MSTFSMTCSCGDVMSVEAENREEAVAKLKAMMTDEAVAAHMADKHPGDPALPTSQVHAMIEQGTQPA